MKIKNLSIRFWITSLIVFSMLLTLFHSTYVSYRLTYKTLITNTLTANEGYAGKIANTTEQFFLDAQRKLENYSNEIAIKLEDQELLQQEMDELLGRSNFFNSVLFVNEQREVKSISPQSLNLNGKVLNSVGVKQALEQKKFLVSDPYEGVTDRLIVMISMPVFDENGEYKGILGGTVYLHENTALKSILENHYFRDDAYLYVVDQNGTLIYHKDKERIGENISENEVVQRLLKGKSGSQQVTNTKKMDMLAGYAPVKISNWGIVSQTPTEKALLPCKNLIENMLLYATPFFLALIILSFWLAKLIVRPLKQLSMFSKSLSEGDFNKSTPEISTWYKEAAALKNATMIGVNSLKMQINDLSVEAYTDPLTKLSNRRIFKMITEDWIKNGTPFSILLIDIDNFKSVNDTYGHNMGDEVLQFVAEEMKNETRKNDICFRYGGEEFIVLLPDTTKSDATLIAERLRMKMSITPSPMGGIVTLSIGLASYPSDASNSNDLFELTDKALYTAKKEGKNRIISA